MLNRYEVLQTIYEAADNNYMYTITDLTPNLLKGTRLYNTTPMAYNTWCDNISILADNIERSLNEPYDFHSVMKLSSQIAYIRLASIYHHRYFLFPEQYRAELCAKTWENRIQESSMNALLTLGLTGIIAKLDKFGDNWNTLKKAIVDYLDGVYYHDFYERLKYNQKNIKSFYLPTGKDKEIICPTGKEIICEWLDILFPNTFYNIIDSLQTKRSSNILNSYNLKLTLDILTNLFFLSELEENSFYKELEKSLKACFPITNYHQRKKALERTVPTIDELAKKATLNNGTLKSLLSLIENAINSADCYYGNSGNWQFLYIASPSFPVLPHDTPT